jgi:hypothetical protein
VIKEIKIKGAYKMGWVFTDKGGKRIRDLKGKLTPFFHDNELQAAFAYWRKELRTSPYVNIHKV